MFSNARTIVNLYGFDIRIDPSWILIDALVTRSLGPHVFPASLPGMTFCTYTARASAAMLVFYASLSPLDCARSPAARL
ncbi:MAG: site-2 protease family protein, partial [Tateyamaria sp.]